MHERNNLGLPQRKGKASNKTLQPAMKNRFVESEAT